MSQFACDDNLITIGAFHVGNIQAYLVDLIRVFGLPSFGYDKLIGNISCQWKIRFSDGTIVKIYDWAPDYYDGNGPHRTPRFYYSWHIVAFNESAVQLVNNTFYQTIKLFTNWYDNKQPQTQPKPVSTS